MEYQSQEIDRYMIHFQWLEFLNKILNLFKSYLTEKQNEIHEQKKKEPKLKWVCRLNSSTAIRSNAAVTTELDTNKNLCCDITTIYPVQPLPKMQTWTPIQQNIMVLIIGIRYSFFFIL